MRIVEVIAPSRHTKELIGMAGFYGAADTWWGPPGDDDRQTLRMLVPDESRQRLLDAMEGFLEREPKARIVIASADATIPRLEAQQSEDEAERTRLKTTREELYTEIARGARLDVNYLLLVILSTIVAAIGLAEDNVAVVIGAMVIAPLLGPNIAFAFATSLGDRSLAGQAVTTNAVGLGLSLLLTIGIGLIWQVNLDSAEVMARTDVGLASVALALASGAAAVLSLTTGLSSALVGVMVAVALLPPTAVLGMLLGAGRLDLALGSALLLIVNIVCVLLAAMIVFQAQGVRPRRWLNNTAKNTQSVALNITLWTLLLGVLIGVILLRASDLPVGLLFGRGLG